MLSPSESPWLFTYGSLTTGSAWWGVMTCPDFLEYVAFSADESDLCLFWSVLTNSKCSSKTFVCCRIFVVTWHSETFKDMKPQFNQTSAPHRLVLSRECTFWAGFFHSSIEARLQLHSRYLPIGSLLLCFGSLKWKSLCSFSKCNLWTSTQDDPEMFKIRGAVVLLFTVQCKSDFSRVSRNNYQCSWLTLLGTVSQVVYCSKC